MVEPRRKSVVKCGVGALIVLWTLVSLAVAAADLEAAEGTSAAGGYSRIEALPIPAPRPATRLTAQTQGEIWFDSKTPFDFDVLLEHMDAVAPNSTLGHLYVPDSASSEHPVPAMVVLPGSGGVKLGRQMLYADLLVQNGYAALVVDYYASRGIDDDTVPYEIMVGNVTEFDVVADAYAALNALQSHPAIDSRRIGVMGFSYGGMATRLTMDDRLRTALARGRARFAVHVDFYGPCFQNFRTTKTTGAPLLTLRGGHDSSNDLVACAIQEEQLRAAGSEVGSVVYATAGHSWGNLGPRYLSDATHIRGCQMDYDEHGLLSVRGRQVIPANTPIDRAKRYRLRMESGDFFQGCLVKGYIVGRDEAVYQASNAELLRFLEVELRGR